MNLFARLDGPRWTALAIVLAAILFLAVNILGNFWLGKFRIDATEGDAYTISKQIQPVFEGIDEPITIRLYYSQVLTTASPRFDPAGSFLGMIGVNVDVTQARRAEADLRELNETLEARVIREIGERRQAEAALQQAQKMEAIGQLTGGVAHDFNNLLQVIAGNLQLLGKDVAGSERAQHRIANALLGVNRGAKLASQLLAFGRRQALEPKTINIGRLVSGMDEMLRRTLGETIEVETVVSGGL